MHGVKKIIIIKTIHMSVKVLIDVPFPDMEQNDVKDKDDLLYQPSKRINKVVTT